MPAFLKKLHLILTGRPFLFIFAAFVIVQLILFSRIGIFTGLEAEKYINEGNQLYDKGQFSEPKYLFYLPVILLVWCCKSIGISYSFIVLMQVLLSGLSLWCFYRLAKLLSIGGTSCNNIAFYSSLLLALFVPLQVWNFYLYSDSIFISLTIIYTYIIYANRNNGVKGIARMILFTVLLVFSRPNGLLFIPVLIIYLLFRRKQIARVRAFGIFACLLLSVGLYALVNAVFTGGGELDVLRPFIEEHIICFVPEKPEGVSLDIIRTQHPLNDLVYYATHNPVHFMRLTALKLVSFFNLVRPYYSTLHNIALIVFMIPVYLLACFGAYRFVKIQKNLSLFLIFLLLIYPLGISLQCDDWHSRFTMVIIPYLIFLAVYGLAQLRTLFLIKKNHELL